MSKRTREQELEAKLAEMQRQNEELQKRLATQQSGSGAIAQDGGIAAGERGVAVKEIQGGVFTGDNLSITYIVQQVKREDEQVDEDRLHRQIANYLVWVRDRFGTIELRGVHREGRQVVQLDLETVYIPLAAVTYDRRDIELNEILKQGQRLIITGGPGSGKTTVLQHVAFTLATALLTDQPDLAAKKLGWESDTPKSETVKSDGLQVDDDKPKGLPLPIFVPLSTYAQERRKGKGIHDRTLATFITQYLIEKQSGLNLPADFFTLLLDSGQGVLLLLDGLDEVPDEQERTVVREAVENLVTGRERMRVIVTCRTAAYRGRTSLGRDFREVQVKALDNKYITNLVQQAYRAVYASDPTLCQTKTDELLRGISDLEVERQRRLEKNVERLVDSPLLVRMLLVVHLSERRLPEHRAELYMRATDTMLWPEHTLDEEVAQYLGRLVGGTHESHRELVQHLAFAMHRRGPKQGREIEEAGIRRVLSEVPEFIPLIDSFLTLTRLRGTLLEERMGVYRFIHLAFQEYLAARYLAEVKRSEGGVEAIARFLEEGPVGDAWWREPTLLVVGYLTLTAPRAASQLLRRLVSLKPARATRLSTNFDALFIATQLALTTCLEWLSTDEALRQDLAEGTVTLLRNVDLARYSQARLRAELGNSLAKIGDPRFNASKWYLPNEPLLGFIAIPADPFTRRGSSTSEEKDKAGRLQQPEVTLPSYYIARYPVTVAQFRAFCNACNYQPSNSECLREPPNRPVRFVSWREALHYCAWLTETLRIWEGTPEPLATLLRSGTNGSPPWQITMPSEAEWAEAARGIDGRIYPWGNNPDPNATNCAEHGIDTTSAVGIFPNGASPYGCLDMAGNVWEWTRSLGNIYDSKSIERVLCGGAYYMKASAVDCGARGRNNPDRWNFYYGFRVVASPFTSGL